MKLERRLAAAVAATATVGAMMPGIAQATPAVVVCTSLASLIPCPAFSSHPSQISLGSDGRTQLLDLRWTGWGRSSTSGSGVLREDTGPAGRPEYQRRRAAVTLSRVQQCDGHRAYTNVRVETAEGDSEYRGCLPRGIFPDG
jgi:hypothetical protein